MRNKTFGIAVFGLSFLGFLDAAYISAEAFLHRQVSCSIISGCSDVLTSKYSHIGSLPIAAIGMVYYLFLLVAAAILIQTDNAEAAKVIKLVVSLGFGVSLVLVYLQLFVIHAICLYCMVSAIITTALFVMVYLKS